VAGDCYFWIPAHLILLFLIACCEITNVLLPFPAASPPAAGPAAPGVPPATLPAPGAPAPAGTTVLPAGIIRVAGGRFADDNCREFTFSGWNQCVAPMKRSTVLALEET